MRKLAALCVALAACIAAPQERGLPPTVSGSSPLVGAFERAAERTGVPVELLATIAHIETRFRIVDDAAHGRTGVGIFGLDDGAVAHGAELAGVSVEAARTDVEAGVLAGAMLIAEAAPDAVTLDDHVAKLSPTLQAAVTRSLARGIDGKDRDGRSIVIAARPSSEQGLGMVTQAVGYDGATWMPASTANYDVANRGVGDITNIVIHTTQGSFGGTISWFQNPDAQVSAHYVVRSEDGYVVQMVDEKNVAWHDRCFNSKTVGIEHEGFIADPELWYTEPMYLESAKLTSYLADKYGIAKEYGAIVGHDAAPDCSDHVDPGDGWNWDHYIEMVKTGGALFDGGDVLVQGPPTIVAGERATITVTLTNRGNTAWELDVTRLGTALPQDRDSELFVEGDWIAPNRATSVDGRIEPGASGTFTFDIVGPDVSSPTVFDEAFQLVEEDVTWFGPDIHVVVQVMPRADRGGCSTSGGGSGALLVALVAFCARVTRRRVSRSRERARRL